MVRTIIHYPDPSIRLISANVRSFDGELKEWISDMIDTMKGNDLDALSAIFIGIQYSIIVINEEGVYTPYINARLIKHSGISTQTERSIYYKGISADVDRYEKVTVLYEDVEGNPHHRDLSGEMARIMQKEVDYCWGSTFVDRVDSEMKERIGEYLEFGLVKDLGNLSCPAVFYRDYLKKGAKTVMGAIVLTFFLPFFVSDPLREKFYTIDLYTLAIVPLIMGLYFWYAQIEAKKYKQCTSCQTGNIIGATLIMGVQWVMVMAGVFWWMAP